ncbi:MAG: energy transducer TonB [Pseudomonadota bacterium]|nr:energy transducer TonB [Pseudomonadota bacterium]
MQIIEPAKPVPPATTPATTPRPAPAASTRTAAASTPVPISQVSPRYPRDALRSGIGGLVRVAVDVGPDGVPTSVSLAEGSGSRELDRAALDAVRRWRFKPAIVNGQPSVGRVVVPIQFTPE